MSNLRIGIGMGMLLLVALAGAEPGFWETYRGHYGLKEGFPNLKAGCLNCHSSVPRRNPYGKSVEEALKLASARAVTPEILAGLEAEDSDGDGFSNGDEIKAGYLPGDPRSHPDGDAPLPVNPVEVEFPTEDTIPAHSFHPLFVHFPIALFLFGAFLDVVGFRRGDDGLRRFAVWNLGAGALFALPTVLTGLAAMLALEKALENGMLIHFAAGLSGALLMLATFLVRRKGDPPTGVGYWVLLGLACTATTVAGHFGAMLVFGS